MENDKRVTVLLVDDEENILNALRRLLIDEDFNIETAISGESALAKLQTLDNVGVIVSDQRMPGMNGAEFLELSQKIAPDALRILLTGYSDINATIDAINMGGAGRYFSKPWDDDELTLAIRNAVRFYTQGTEKRRLNEIISQQRQELEEWNENLKKRLLQSTATIREQNRTLKTLDEKSPVALIDRAFDGFFDVISNRNAVHSRTVSTLVTAAARKMGLDAEMVATFRLAALLHDTGKFGNLAADLYKHLEEMSESEANEYRQHPLYGEVMFSQLEELAGILPLIRNHHEAFDGSGFPDGLQGEAFPLGARLIAIADFIEKSTRSVDNNKAEYALMQTRYHSGTLFDPQLVANFKDITKVIYSQDRNAGEVAEVEINHMDLVLGMTVARDIKSNGGVLLMQRGSILDDAGVALIRNQYRKNPPPHGIFVRIIED